MHRTQLRTCVHVIDYVAERLLAQKKRSVLPHRIAKKLGQGNEVCGYRGEHGLKCGIGHLISERHYRVGIEGQRAIKDGPLNAVFKSCPNLSAEARSIWLLDKLQDIHDSVQPRSWRKAFAGLRRQYAGD